jgi:hypothetical protein
MQLPSEPIAFKLFISQAKHIDGVFGETGGGVRVVDSAMHDVSKMDLGIFKSARPPLQG